MIPRKLQERLARLERAQQPAEELSMVYLEVPGKSDMALIGGRIIAVPDGRRLLAEYGYPPAKVLVGIDPDLI